MATYLDASALVKLYVAEVGSGWVGCAGWWQGLAAAPALAPSPRRCPVLGAGGLCRIYGPPTACKGYFCVTATKVSTACLYPACPWSADGASGSDGICAHAPDQIFDLVMVLATPRVCTSWSNQLRHHCVITSAIIYGGRCLRTPQ